MTGRTSIGFLALLLVGCSSPATSAIPSGTSLVSTPAAASAAASTASSPIPGSTSTSLAQSAVTSTTPRATTARPPTNPAVDADRILIFHRTTGFRHSSIPAGITAISELVGDDEIGVAPTDDPAIFTDDGLAPFRVIVFLSTTGDVLDDDQEQAMERFVNAGGGFVGIHAAADTEYDWPWYGGLVGAYFLSHPAPQLGLVEVLTTYHPVTAGMPAEFTVNEEWYDFQTRPGPAVTVLATVDEQSYVGATMGAPHPVAWAHEYEGGRSVYLAFGHDDGAFTEPLIRQMLDQALTWAAGPG